MESGHFDSNKCQEWTEDRVAELRRLWMSGMKTRDIAARMGIGNGSVCGKARRLDLPMRDRGGLQLRGPANPSWRGGRQASWNRSNAKRRKSTTVAVKIPKVSLPRKRPGRICGILLGNRFS